MGKKSKKLNSMRILEQHDIPYEVLHYETGTRDAEEVAELIGVPEFMVYKTLIVQPVAGKDVFITMIASDRQLDLKRFAAAIGEKKVQMASHTDAESLTGLQVGGISALMLMNKNWSVYLDQPAMDLQHIVISAGERGTQLRVPVTPLINFLRAKIIDMSDEKTE